jgi:hypothetical protein
VALSAAERLAAAEEKRAERKKALEAPYAEQRLVDVEALDSLEIEHGDSNVTHVDVPFTPGLPTLVAGKCPTPDLVKRYQARITPKKDGSAHMSPADAASEIGAACRAYPDAETFAKIVEARPGIVVQLGVECLKLAAGRASSEGKG